MPGSKRRRAWQGGRSQALRWPHATRRMRHRRSRSRSTSRPSWHRFAIGPRGRAAGAKRE
eukprot:5397060-Prymnesium_polylepis.1